MPPMPPEPLMDQQCFHLFQIDFGFGDVCAWLIARQRRPAVCRRLLAQHVADLAAAIALADVFAFAPIIHETIFVQAADRHPDNALTVRQNDAFLSHEVGQVATDRFAHAFFVAGLVLIALSGAATNPRAGR